MATGPQDATVSHAVIIAAGRDRARVVVVWSGGHLERDLPESGTLRIGRSLDCELSIDHPSVSRHHATLHLGRGVAIEDAGSSNGTFVGSSRLAAKEKRPLNAGDAVHVGAALVLVQTPALAAAPKAAASKPDSADEQLTTIAASGVDVLVLGETGAGKEVTADELHRRSPRAKKPLVKINCAALPDGLLEAELFGFERGAFTGADRAKEGLIESAHGGTVFLDELGELPLSTQVKLLRVVEAREVMHLGALKPLKVDVRFIAATNRDIEVEVEEKRFRADLYYRLAGVVLRVPPLRERVGEIRGLAERFIAETCERASRPVLKLEAEAVRRLEQHPFPGNVRELRKVLERSVLFCKGNVLRAADLQLDSPSSTKPAADATLTQKLDAKKRERVEQALLDADGNQGAAADLLGVSRRTLSTWLDELGITRPRKGR